jgi:hypothetical protein
VPRIPVHSTEETLETLLDIHKTSLHRPTSSKNIQFLHLVISCSVHAQSFWLNRTGWAHCDPKARVLVLSARLHSLHGPTAADVGSARMRGAAREAIYRISNFTEENDWGPVRKDGSGCVDWVLMEAATLVIRLNCIHANRDRSWTPIVHLPLGFDFSRTEDNNRTEREQDTDWDWAGVGENWVGAYAFLGMPLSSILYRLFAVDDLQSGVKIILSSSHTISFEPHRTSRTKRKPSASS